jgi:hypothetical protein
MTRAVREEVDFMKILHLGTTDIAGGAARASFRLHWALRKQGYEIEGFEI